MAVPWSTEYLVSTTERKHPQLYYYRNLAMRILHLSVPVCDSGGIAMCSGPGPSCLKSITNFPIPGTRYKEGLGRHGLNVWRRISLNVVWMPLIHKTYMHGEPVFGIARYCLPHRMGHVLHLNLKMDMNGWKGGWTLGFKLNLVGNRGHWYVRYHISCHYKPYHQRG